MKHNYWVDPNYNKKDKRFGVFIDRDGVILKEVHLLHQKQDIQIIPEAILAIKLLNNCKIPAILVTNQTVVARGMATEQFVIDTHKYIQAELKKHGAYLDGIFYCPHSSQADVMQYKLDCSWRKPKPGMILKAKQLMNIDLSKSWMIGDTARDILTADNVDMQSILVQTGHAGKDAIYQVDPKIIKQNILKAVEYICKQ